MCPKALLKWEYWNEKKYNIFKAFGGNNTALGPTAA